MLHVIAGYGSNGEFLNDVRVLNLGKNLFFKELIFQERMEWLPSSAFTVAANNFSRRFRQASAVVNNKIFLFGGSGSGVLLSDMFVLRGCTPNEKDKEEGSISK